jgi:Ca-activated chloride channel family protein
VFMWNRAFVIPGVLLALTIRAPEYVWPESLYSFESTVAQEAPQTSGNNVPAVPSGVAYVSVLDNHDQPIVDLKEQEFRLFVDKVERKIVSASPAVNEPLTIGFFFDISGSRREDTHVTEETKLASSFVHSIWRDGDSAFLVGFSQKPIAVVQPTRSLEQFDEGLEQIPGGFWGPTALYDALCVATPEKLNGVPGRKIYVVLSDFEDNSSRNKLENVVAIARKSQIAIFPVILSAGFGGGYSKKSEKRARETAQKIAGATGGEVLIPESPKQLASIFARIGNDIHAAYRITYTPSSFPEDSHKKQLRIETTRQDTKLLFARD